MTTLPRVALLLSWLCTAATALAWNKAGHMTTGAIAYRQLKSTDPAALARVVAALRLHPQYAPYWQAPVEQAGEEGDQMLLMLAARWPDDVRGRPEYHHDVWHYINYPYHPPSTKTEKPDGDNIVDELEKNRALVKTSADAGARAIALCWVMHLTGDIHQPLHVTQLINGAFPTGDRGGTVFFIRVDAGETLSLHQLWDGLVIGSDRYQAVRNTASELVNRPEFAPAKFAPELAETSAEKWALNESFPLAVKYVYRDGTLGGGRSKTNGEPLPADYLKQAKPVAERQLVLAGYRMAATLRLLMR